MYLGGILKTQDKYEKYEVDLQSNKEMSRGNIHILPGNCLLIDEQEVKLLRCPGLK